jgi:hypothetical protein
MTSSRSRCRTPPGTGTEVRLSVRTLVGSQSRSEPRDGGPQGCPCNLRVWQVASEKSVDSVVRRARFVIALTRSRKVRRLLRQVHEAVRQSKILRHGFAGPALAPERLRLILHPIPRFRRRAQLPIYVLLVRVLSHGRSDLTALPCSCHGIRRLRSLDREYDRRRKPLDDEHIVSAEARHRIMMSDPQRSQRRPLLVVQRADEDFHDRGRNPGQIGECSFGARQDDCRANVQAQSARTEIAGSAVSLVRSQCATYCLPFEIRMAAACGPQHADSGAAGAVHA